MKALRDSIILRPFKMEEVTPGGIVVKQSYSRHDADLSIGEVLDVGPMGKQREMYHDQDFKKDIQKIEVGNLVLTARQSGYHLKIKDEPVQICLPGDILATLTKEEANSMTAWTGE